MSKWESFKHTDTRVRHL